MPSRQNAPGSTQRASDVVWYWFRVPWACGALLVRSGRIVGGAPIFRAFVGQQLDVVTRRYGQRCAIEQLRDDAL